MLKQATLFFLLFIAAAAQAQSSRRLHFKAIVADTHNDILSEAVLDGVDISTRVARGHSDLVRWKEGGVDLQFFSVWTGERARNKEGYYADALQLIDSLDKLVAKNPTRILLAKSFKKVKKGLRQDKLVALIGVEGGHMIENDMTKLVNLYERGMRYLTLTWNNSTAWASSAMLEDSAQRNNLTIQKGLSAFGRDVIRKMNELGIIVDLSHTGEQTFYDAIATTSKPVLLSHSSVWELSPVFRNVKDEQIKAVAKNGGVICVNFYSGFIKRGYDATADSLVANLRSPFQDSMRAITRDSTIVRRQWRRYIGEQMTKYRPTLSELVDHIDYIVRLVGDRHVGLGSDYDGVSSLPIGLEDVTTYPKITEELLRRGYSKKSVRRILGENVLRVMRANFKN